MKHPSAHPVSAQSILPPSAAAARPGRVRPWLAAGALLLAILGPAGYALLPLVYPLLLGYGTLLVETDDQAIEVTLRHPDGHSERVEVAGQSRQGVHLAPGEYRVRLRERDSGARSLRSRTFCPAPASRSGIPSATRATATRWPSRPAAR